MRAPGNRLKYDDGQRCPRGRTAEKNTATMKRFPSPGAWAATALQGSRPEWRDCFLDIGLETPALIIWPRQRQVGLVAPPCPEV